MCCLKVTHAYRQTDRQILYLLPPSPECWLVFCLRDVEVLQVHVSVNVPVLQTAFICTLQPLAERAAACISARFLVAWLPQTARGPCAGG